MIQINRPGLINENTIFFSQQEKVFPTATYFNDLDLYRSISNENSKTANHLTQLSQWDYFKNILDIGCGDGRMILELFKLYGILQNVEKIHLIDLEENRVERAKKFFLEFNKTNNITIQKANIMDCLPDCFDGIDMALLIHVVYYLEEDELEKLIDCLPKNVPLLVVVDKEDSIFSHLWEFTAPNYLKRSNFANDYIKKLTQRSNFEVLTTTIESEITNPYILNQNEKTTILSFMCYNEYETLDDESIGKIKSIFKEFTSKDNLTKIQTNCFYIIKK